MLNRLKRNESYSRSESDFEINWRLEEENASLNEQLVKMEDALTVARMDAGDAAEKIHNLEMKLNALEKDKIDEEGVFNAKLEEYISKMSSQQKHAEDALVQLKTKNESLSKRLRKRFDHFLSSVWSKKVTKLALLEGTYDMKSSQVPLNSFFIDIYWYCQYILVKPNKFEGRGSKIIGRRQR